MQQEGRWRVHLPRLPIPVMAPKRSASASPEPSTASRDAISDSSSDGERLQHGLLGRPCAACWAVHVLGVKQREGEGALSNFAGTRLRITNPWPAVISNEGL